MGNIQTFEGFFDRFRNQTISEVQHGVTGLLYEIRNINDNLRKFKKLELTYWNLSPADKEQIKRFKKFQDKVSKYDFIVKEDKPFGKYKFDINSFMKNYKQMFKRYDMDKKDIKHWVNFFKEFYDQHKKIHDRNHELSFTFAGEYDIPSYESEFVKDPVLRDSTEVIKKMNDSLYTYFQDWLDDKLGTNYKEDDETWLRNIIRSVRDVMIVNSNIRLMSTSNHSSYPKIKKFENKYKNYNYIIKDNNGFYKIDLDIFMKDSSPYNLSKKNKKRAIVAMSKEHNMNKKYIEQRREYISPFIKDPEVNSENSFKKMNEGLNLKKMNPNELLITKQGNKFFINIIQKELGASVRQTTTYGYEVSIPYNQKNKEILESWHIQYGFDYEVNRITNPEHPDYPGLFFSFNFYKSHELKNIDTSEIIKKMNESSNNIGFGKMLKQYNDEHKRLNKELNELDQKYKTKFIKVIKFILEKVGEENINRLMDEEGELEEEIFNINLEYFNRKSDSIDIGFLGGLKIKNGEVFIYINTAYDTYPIEIDSQNTDVIRDIVEMLLNSKYIVDKLSSSSFKKINN